MRVEVKPVNATPSVIAVGDRGYVKIFVDNQPVRIAGKEILNIDFQNPNYTELLQNINNNSMLIPVESINAGNNSREIELYLEKGEEVYAIAPGTTTYYATVLYFNKK
jgi:hypothetical protein